MDADTLRLILIVAGGLFLAGLYLWERHRSQRRQRRRRPAAEVTPRQRTSEPRREPRLGALEGAGESASDALGLAGSVEPEARPTATETEPTAPAAPLLVQLHVVAQEGRFDGAAIVRAAGRCDLEPGEMDIFHRYDGDEGEAPLFSMANMVKPGTFPFGAMAGFETPGLTLFTQAEGDPSDTERLDTMLATAEALAEELDGQVLDDQRRPLTEAAEARLRALVLSHSGRSVSGHRA